MDLGWNDSSPKHACVQIIYLLKINIFKITEHHKTTPILKVLELVIFY